MRDKIVITDADLNYSARTDEVSKEKIVLCELKQDAVDSTAKEIPLAWYLILLLPVISVIAVIWGCFQKKFKFTYQLPAAIICLLSTLLPLFLFTQMEDGKANWKNSLAKKAQRGVVFVAMEDRGWLKNHSGVGTGVVVAKRGDVALVLTNRHVVCKSNGKLAKTIKVITSAGRALPTEVVAIPRNENVDMVLLSVGNAAYLEVLGDIGDFDAIKTGDEVVAIGHPNGLAFTMTQGIVSALRENMYIQSSASINPGNSGGPLLNSHGRIIGVNTFFIKDSQGLNFAFRADFILKKGQWIYTRNIDDLLGKITTRK